MFSVFARLLIALLLLPGLAACERDPRPATDTMANEPGLSPGMKRPWSLPLNNPMFVPAEEAAPHMRPRDIVAGVVINGKPRAYPWWIVNAYHVVNDTIRTTAAEAEAVAPAMHRVLEAQRQKAVAALEIYRRGDPRGQRKSAYVGRYMKEAFIPLLVTVCEACIGTAAFIPVVEGPLPTSGRRLDSTNVEFPDDMLGRPLVFQQCRSRGPEPDSYNAIGVFTICDTQTHSRWHPFTGVAMSGPLAGRRLVKLPAVSDYWENWVREHPDTIVAFGAKDFLREHSHVTLEMPLHREGTRGHSTFHEWLGRNPDAEDTRLPRHTIVVGAANGRGDAAAYTLETLHALGGVAHAEVGEDAWLFLLRNETMGVVYDRHLDGEALSFEVHTRTPLLLKDGSGSLWTHLGECVSGPHEGRRLAVVQDSYVSRWYEWAANHPGTSLGTAE